MDEPGEEAVADVGSGVRIAGPRIAERQVTLVCGRERHSPAFLSVKTLLGRALLGRRAGDEIEVTTDAGTVKVVVLNVRARQAMRSWRRRSKGDATGAPTDRLGHVWCIVSGIIAVAVIAWVVVTLQHHGGYYVRPFDNGAP